MKFKFLILTALITCSAFAQKKLFAAKEIAINELIDGTLLTPKENNISVLTIIIAGSGPTNRETNIESYS